MPEMKKQFDLEAFKKGYSKNLQSKKNEVSEALKTYERLEKEFRTYQQKYAALYKKAIVKSFMERWDKSGVWPKDDELTEAIFYLADMPLDKNKKMPEVQIHLDNTRCEFKLEYFNSRLKKYMELKP